MNKIYLLIFFSTNFFSAHLEAQAIPACATREFPAGGTVNVSAPQALFSWSNPADATGALFRLGKTNPPNSVDLLTQSPRYYSGLSYNTTYYWSVTPANAVGSASGCPVYSFTTQAAPPIPVNDEPAGAVAIASNVSLSGYTKSATQTQVADSCNGAVGDANDDVWYTFTPLQSGAVSITLKPDLIFDGVMNAYSGTPGSFVSLACADQGSEGQQEILTMPDLTAGVTYYFRVYGFGDAGKDGSFSLAASGITLPVSLIDFKGERNGYRNVLSWTTLAEQNNKGFELQRSANGTNFSTIAFVAARSAGGNSSLPLNYKYDDLKPFTGNCYYRLKQIDNDGRLRTSVIVLLKGFQQNAFALSNIYPNPAKDILNLVLTAPAVNKADIIITDLAGRPVLRQAVQTAAGNNNISLNIDKLFAGNYLIKIYSSGSDKTAMSKFVKL